MRPRTSRNPKQAATEKRHRVRAAQQVAQLLRELTARGLGVDDVIFATDAAMPGLSFTDFAGGVALWRAEEGAEGYVLIPGTLQ